MKINKKLATLVDGKGIADKIFIGLKKKISLMKVKPGLAAILIGDDPASKLYIKNKETACWKVGIHFHKYLCNKDCFPNATEMEIIDTVNFLNRDPEISGIIVQLPIPKKFSTKNIINAINPQKDIDGFHPQNYKKFLSGKKAIISPLIQSILAIFNEYRILLPEKKILIISNSQIFSQGLDKALEDNGANSINITKSTDKNLILKTKNADVLISIVGSPKCITGAMVKKDAVVIDVGITKTKRGFRGDVDMASVKKKASLLTPTPGGVGPITVAMLLQNTYETARRLHHNT